jgi:hypothetical protein
MCAFLFVFRYVRVPRAENNDVCSRSAGEKVNQHAKNTEQQSKDL